MAVVIKEGNVFDSDADIICHQVNCRSVMGSGVAKEVRERYPEVYYAYLDRCYNAITNHNHTLLGTAQFVKVSDNRCIVNLHKTITDMMENNTPILLHYNTLSLLSQQKQEARASK